MRNYWLFKSEPDVFSIDDLFHSKNQTTLWDGVRNYQARNFLRDEIQNGDTVFFYHSNCETPGIVGTAEVVQSGYPDPSAFDPQSDYYDPKTTPEKPRWYTVDIRFKEKFKRCISLAELKTKPALSDMPLVRKGNRLSVTPVTEAQWKTILKML